MQKRGTKICCSVCSILSIAFLVLAIVILVLNQTGFIKKKVDDVVLEQLTLEEGHQTYEQWVDPTIPMYKDFYVFNLTNPSQFAAGAKPHFDELGPYRYRERRVKTILNHYRDNGTIEYTMNRTFHFEQFGNFSEDDIITTINFVYVTALNTSAERGEAWLLKLLVELLIWPKPQLLVEVRAGDLFWSYSDHFLKKLYQFGQVPSDYINLQYNDSEYDRLNKSIIHSGEKNSRLTADLIQWAGRKRLGNWRNFADNVTGTEGILWQPFLKQDEEIVGFISDTQRSFRLRSNEVSSVSGIEVFRFRVEDKEFKPNPDYWTDNVTTPDGLLYLGVLQEPRAPVYGSKPHFLDCDPSLRTAVEGIREPDRSLDDIIVDIEPITGSTLNVHLQLQVNINVTKSSMFFPFDNINPPLYFPMFYIDEWARIDEALKSKLENMVFRPLTAISVSIWVAFGLCCFISLLTGLIAINRCIKLYQLYHRDEVNIPLLDQPDT